jgi:hypothetical protein
MNMQFQGLPTGGFGFLRFQIFEFLKMDFFFWGEGGGGAKRIVVDVLVLYASHLSMQFLDLKGEKYII